MMKDSEWGAVAYLSHSKYGINSEIYKNNSKKYYTGRSGGDVAGSQVKVDDKEYVDDGFYTYDGKCVTTSVLAPGIASECTVIGNGLKDKTLSYKASTTGNIYGIYDMSGGSWEYTMSMYRPENGAELPDESGFQAFTTATGNLPLNKYWNRYTTGVVTKVCDGNPCYGYALSETSGWYNDHSAFVSSVHPWSFRSGIYSLDDGDCGIFHYSSNVGLTAYTVSFRIVLVKE